jgi:hypothetical protein
MGFVFISHASEDKPRVRPVVQALAFLDVKVWIDRPGFGPNHFNFDQDFIAKYDIRGIKAGSDYDSEISEALYQCGAVLVCLSRALNRDRQILVNELVFGKIQQKLVACLVDDLPYPELPGDLGLGDASRIQAERIDPIILQAAVDAIAQGNAASTLTGAMGVQWQIVLSLVRQIETLAPAEPKEEDLRRAAKELVRFPVTPIVRASDIPLSITEIFAERFSEPAAAQGFLARAMRVRKLCNPEGGTEDQILVKDIDVLSPFLVRARDYWDDVLPAAGLRSPRTLAALLLTPGAPDPSSLRPALERDLTEFCRRLERF